MRCLICGNYIDPCRTLGTLFKIINLDSCQKCHNLICFNFHYSIVPNFGSLIFIFELLPFDKIDLNNVLSKYVPAFLKLTVNYNLTLIIHENINNDLLNFISDFDFGAIILITNYLDL